MRGPRTSAAALLVGLMLLLSGCDLGGLFDLGQPDGAEEADDPATPDPAPEDGAPEVPDDSDTPVDDTETPSDDVTDTPDDDDDGAGEAPNTGDGPLAGTDGFFVPPSQAADWVEANADDPRADVIRERIAEVPASIWLTGGGDVGQIVGTAVAAAAAENTVPVLVAYNVPGRDCGQFSAGGANGGDAYRAWVDDFAGAIGDLPAIVILEPDALAGMDCLSEQNQQDRLDLLAYAAEQFAAQAPNTWTYLDAGHAQWQPADVMAERLEAAGIASARGFALNVSNYYTTDENAAYGADVNAALGTAAPFVVDTSRNGNGSNGEWCNPAGRAIGAEPSVGTIGEGLEMELWIKLPGESDGDCGIGAGTAAGEFVPDIAIALAEG